MQIELANSDENYICIIKHDDTIVNVTDIELNVAVGNYVHVDTRFEDRYGEKYYTQRNSGLVNETGEPKIMVDPPVKRIDRFKNVDAADHCSDELYQLMNIFGTVVGMYYACF